MIVLAKRYDIDGKYKGMVVIEESELTPELLDRIKADKDDKMGWKQHKKVLKEKGYNI